MKRMIGLAGVALVVLLVAGCGGFAPVPVIDTFSSSVSTVDTGVSFDLTVTGSTLGAGEASTTDYSGTVTVSSSPGSFVETATIDGDFSETFTVTMSTADSYTFTATLEASDGTIATDTVSVTVNQAWSVPTNAIDLTANEWVQGDIGTAGSVDWYHKTSMDASTYYFHWFEDNGTPGDDSNVADIVVTVYDEDGSVLFSRDDFSPSASVSGADQDDLYIKVEAYSSSDTGEYYLTAGLSSAVPTTGSITLNGGSTGSLSAGEIEVWYYDVTSSDTFVFQWEDKYAPTDLDGGSYTADVRVSGWADTHEPLFFEDDQLASHTAQSHYVSSLDDIYMIVQGYSSTSSGSYYVDLDQ